MRTRLVASRAVLSFLVVPSLLSSMATVGCGDDAVGAGGSGGDAGSTVSVGPTTSTASTSGSTSATSSSSSSKASSSSTGLPPTSCEPMAGAVVDDTCGAFVKPGASGSGAIGSPIGSITDAIALGKDRIYVCSGTLDEAVTLPLGVSLYGALDCNADWAWRVEPADDELTHVVAPADVPALHATGQDGDASVVRGFSFEASDAVAPGASSIAAIVRGGQLDLQYSLLKAGRGAAGRDGDLVAGAGDNGPSGNDASVSCAMSSPGGGAINASCNSPASGMGGQGGPVNGYPSNGGVAGSGPLGGAGGQAAHGPGPFTLGGPCSDGQPGLPGPDGADGEGGDGILRFDDDGHNVTSSGLPGLAGQAGGGGGGGGGARGSSSCVGAAGSSGGAGGCGGDPGLPGGGGGSAFGLVSLGASLQLEHVGIVIGRGGDGGSGTLGQVGGLGGPGGSGLDACAGGTGGAGGRGGAGGGGAGGHAIALVYRGAQPTQNGVSFELPDVAGIGGQGVNAGVDGRIAVSEEIVEP